MFLLPSKIYSQVVGIRTWVPFVLWGGRSTQPAIILSPESICICFCQAPVQDHPQVSSWLEVFWTTTCYKSRQHICGKVYCTVTDSQRRFNSFFFFLCSFQLQNNVLCSPLEVRIRENLLVFSVPWACSLLGPQFNLGKSSARLPTSRFGFDICL